MFFAIKEKKSAKKKKDDKVGFQPIPASKDISPLPISKAELKAFFMPSHNNSTLQESLDCLRFMMELVKLFPQTGTTKSN
jgi:hypothetical protein